MYVHTFNKNKIVWDSGNPYPLCHWLTCLFFLKMSLKIFHLVIKIKKSIDVSHIEVFNPCWIYFCVWCQKVVQFHSACCCPDFPTPFVEETIFFSIGYSFLLCPMLVDHRVEGPFLGSLIVPLINVSVFVPVPYSLDDYSSE